MIKLQTKKHKIAVFSLIFLEILCIASNGPGMRAAMISLFFIENNNFLFKIIAKHTLKRFNCNMFSKENFRIKIPHNKRVARIIISYIKIAIF